jgi:hypothetical protein
MPINWLESSLGTFLLFRLVALVCEERYCQRLNFNWTLLRFISQRTSPYSRLQKTNVVCVKVNYQHVHTVRDPLQHNSARAHCFKLFIAVRNRLLSSNAHISLSKRSPGDNSLVNGVLLLCAGSTVVLCCWLTETQELNKVARVCVMVWDLVAEQ